MFDFLKNVRWSLLLIGIINIVIGVAMIMYPETASDTVVKIIGGIMAASAVVSILGYLVDRKHAITAYSSLLVGAIMLIMGAILFFTPATFVEYIGYIFAVIVGVQGINLIAEGFSHKKYKGSSWGQTILMGLICVALAVIVFLNPFNTFKALMILTGVALILAGLLNIVVAARIGAAVHSFNKAVKLAETELVEEKDAVEAELKDIREAVETVETKAAEVVEAIKADPVSVDAAEIKTEEQPEAATEASREIPSKLDAIKLDFSEKSE